VTNVRATWARRSIGIRIGIPAPGRRVPGCQIRGVRRDAGDPLRDQRNALDSGFVFDLRVNHTSAATNLCGSLPKMVLVRR
jgi:hypothetical protein